MVYISVMELLIGVPVANTTPLPPVSSSMYLHFINRSLLFALRSGTALLHCAFGDKKQVLVEMRLVYKQSVYAEFLKGDNVVFAALVVQFFQLQFQVLFSFSICLMVNRSARSCFAWAIPCVISSICSCNIAACFSLLSGIFSNCE